MSELEDQLARYRKAILDKDRAAQLRLLNTYRTAMDRLAPLIELVQFDINSMDEPTPVRIFQLERYKILERQLREEMDRLAQETGTLVRGGQADVIQLGFDAARDIAAASADDPATVAGSFAGVPRDAVLDLVGMLEPDSPTGQLLASFGEVATKAIRDALTSGVILGKNPRVVAQAVRHATGMQASRALTISRTEMLRSYRTAKLQRYAANADILDGWKWVSAKQRRTCAACLAMDGETFPLSVTFFPAHPACFVAGTLVSGPQATAGMSRWYSGDVIEVQTERGRRITVTPNHPILTTEGWVAAGLLNEGSNLIGSAIREGDFVGIDGDDDNVPALIEEIAHSLRSAGAVRSIGVPPSPEHFHGDGLGSEIEIVWSDRLLRDARYPAIRQSFTQDRLIRRSMQAAFLSRASGLTTLLERFDATTRCIVCGLSQPLAFFGAGALHPHQHAFAPIARGDARLNEASPDRRSHDVVLGSERLFGLSREVPLDNLGNGQRTPREVPNGDAAFFQHGGDSTGADHVRPSDLLQRLAGKVAPDRIVRINRVGFEGHVYNLETTEGWYYANGIIAHNCRCTARPVLNEKYAAKRAPLETGDQWLRRQDADTQDAILGKQGGQAFRDGEVELRDFVRTDKDPKWGESKRDGGIAWARKQAERRTRTVDSPDRTRIKQATQRLSSAFPDIDVNLDGIPDALAADALEQFTDLAERYPWAVKEMRRFGVGNVPGYGHAAASRLKDEILLNREAWASPSFLKTLEDEKASNWAQATSARSIVTHEFGHMIDFVASTGRRYSFTKHMPSIPMKYGGEMDGNVREVHRAWKLKTLKMPLKRPSIYARESDSEAWAEAFTERVHSPKSEWSELTREIDGYLTVTLDRKLYDDDARQAASSEVTEKDRERAKRAFLSLFDIFDLERP